ncbi:DMT family transporter [Desulfococcaceae bacterium HSG8]|nr:DMT family transporter [Desulfococcaceae bacterium HSG8]
MINSEALAITYGLSTAVTWGAADFSGGFATKRNSVFMVVLLSQIIGVAFLITLAFAFAEKLPGHFSLLIGGLGGISGALGTAALYRGLAQGHMGVVAPISAVVTAILPIIFAFFTQGFPKISQISGFAIAILSVWFISCAGDSKIRGRELCLAAGSGLGFGLFFICIGSISCEAVFWPLVAARFASLGLLSFYIFARRRAEIPAKNQFPFIALTGILDAGGNAFFALAAQSGRLDISAVIASLYPAATIMLAWFILKERLLYRQWIGVTTALLSLCLIAL